MLHASLAWLKALDRVYTTGQTHSPRGMETKEVLGLTSVVDMRYPVVNVPGRKIGFKFMSAEAAWILSGDNRLETIGPFSKDISKFSDDGVFFKGAYGPQVVDQLSGVVSKLASDQDTRQAVMTIWRQNPVDTKDVPCTVSAQWFIRDGKLHCIDSMRSSDLWLGWPYDVFNFSMLSYYILSMLEKIYGVDLEIGALHLVAGSQHIYQRNYYGVCEILYENAPDGDIQIPAQINVTKQLYALTPSELVERLWEVSRDGDGAVDLGDDQCELNITTD